MMRRIIAAGLLTVLSPLVAVAQTPAASPPPTNTPTQSAAAPAGAAPAAPRARGGDITRDDYIERAKQNAARRFDAMDANHDGVLTADERRTYRDSHRRQRAGSQPSQ